MKLFGYGLSFERPQIKVWMGVQVPFILNMRLHYPNGSRIWFNILGPNFVEWAKSTRLRTIQNKIQ